MLYLRRHYRLLHLDAALNELYGPKRNRAREEDQRTPLVMTFDDGYRDNYTYASRLADELQVPITIFLVPGYIDNGRRFWWMESAHLLAHARVKQASISGRTYHLDRPHEREALAQAIDSRLRFATSVGEREQFLDSVRMTLDVPTVITMEERDSLPLTWTEVQEMRKSPWISFGAHSMHHPILKRLADPAEVQYEVRESRATLEQRLERPVHTFAYPIGQPEHIGDLAVRAVQEAGYDWAVTTVEGFNTPQTDPYFLFRYVVDVGQHWSIVAAKASGLWTLLKCASGVKRHGPIASKFWR
jgi:peptidoglycan/xylan/chitin deacetylase (PgdA/CDA1 family)